MKITLGYVTKRGYSMCDPEEENRAKTAPYGALTLGYRFLFFVTCWHNRPQDFGNDGQD